MSLNFSTYPAADYVGTPFSLPIQLGKGFDGRCVPLSVNWLAYGCGDNQPNLVVNINLVGGVPNSPRPLLDKIRSIYIDNTGGAKPIYVRFADTNFTVTCQPFSTGWYPIFSNALNFFIAGLEFNNSNLTTTLLYITNILAPPYSDVALQSVLSERLASPTIAGGGGLVSMLINATGSSFPNGIINVSGGGGTGMQVAGILDAYGRFIGYNIINPGQNYTGPPTLTPAAAQVPPPAFNPAGTYNNLNQLTYTGTIWYWNNIQSIALGSPVWVSSNWPAGAQVSYAGYIWIAKTNILGGQPAPPTNPSWQLIGPTTPTSGTSWVDTGIVPSQPASFTAIVSSTSRIVSTGNAPAALGDQVSDFIAHLSGLGVYTTNIFGSPFQSGFIYITNAFVFTSSSNATIQFRLESSDGAVDIFNFIIQLNAGQTLLDLQGCNIKIDATKTWQIRVTNTTGSADVKFTFAYTFSQT